MAPPVKRLQKLWMYYRGQLTLTEKIYEGRLVCIIREETLGFNFFPSIEWAFYISIPPIIFSISWKTATDTSTLKVAAKVALESFLDGVKKGLKKRNSRVTLVGFGTFKTVYWKTRMGRNPQTGEKSQTINLSLVFFVVFFRADPFGRICPFDFLWKFRYM